MGNFTAAKVYAYESRRLAKIMGNLAKEITALRHEAFSWKALGAYEHCIDLCKQAKDLVDALDLAGGQADLLNMNTEAEAHRMKSEYIEAHNINTQLLHGAPGIDYAWALLNIAELDVVMGTPKDEIQLKVCTAKSIFKTFSLVAELTYADIVLANLDLREGNFPEAQKTFKTHVAPNSETNAEIITLCLQRLGDFCCWAAPWTTTWTTVFLAYVIRTRQNVEIYKALQFLGDVFLAEGDRNTAINLFTVALEGFTQMDVHHGRAECMLRLGNISMADKNFPQAIELWTTARPLFERSSQRTQVQVIDRQLSTVN
ncbi:hypothetical protein K438DRAFT_1767131 [Mycena galopus ATCC 62051]|nr:hypothetical protein K438DRAFT_1767131 [Mycena galopus ATCC 62051]